MTLFLDGKYLGGKPEVREPENCEEWAWFQKCELPDYDLFSPIKNLIKSGYDIFGK